MELALASVSRVQGEVWAGDRNLKGISIWIVFNTVSLRQGGRQKRLAEEPRTGERSLRQISPVKTDFQGGGRGQ